MKLSKAEDRDRKIHRKKHGQRESGRSNFLSQRMQWERAQALKEGA